MLQVIRDRAQGFIVWFIVGAIVLSFALFGINDYFSGDQIGSEVATVNGNKVSNYEYQIAYQNERSRMQQMFGQNMDLDMFDEQIKQSAFERVIDNAVVMQKSLDMGFRVSDEQVASLIHNIEAFKEEGRFSKAAYEAQLRVSGETPAGFEQRIRRGLLADQMIRGVAGSSFATPYEIETLHRLREQEREAEYFTIKKDDFKDGVKIDDAAIEARYNENKDNYKTQEMVSVDYVELTVDALMSQVDATESEAKEMYEQQKDQFVAPAEVKARHILISTDDDEAAAKAKADELYQRIKKGESFEKLAKENSDDPGSAEQGGDLGFFARGVMVPEFDEKAFSLSVGSVSEPVKTDFGYHIIKVEDKRGGKGKSFADVKDQLLDRVKRQKAERLYFDKVEILANEAFESPQSLEPAADELGLKIQSSPAFSRAGGPGIASERKVRDAAFSNDVLQERFNSQALELGPNRTVVIRIKEHKPAEVRPLAQVRSRIESELQREKTGELAQQKGDELIAKIKDGKSLASIAKANKYDLKKKAWIKRKGSDFNQQVVTQLFTLPAPSEKAVVEGVELSNGDYAVVALHGVRDADVGSLAGKEKESLQDEIANASGVIEYSGLLDSLKAQAEIERFPQNL